MKKNLRGKVCLLGAASALALLSANSRAFAQEAGAADEARSVDEVVVTARRRDENLQRTPVAVQVISAEQLEGKGIRNLYDLTSVTPGVNFTMGASKANPIFSIRGMSRGVIGNGQPAVGIYFNEVPSLLRGTVLPTYDLASIQILKGPQGTLFGRNTTAGAVLATSKPPTYQFGASAEVTLGSYDWRQLDAVLNVPLIADKAALRVAINSPRRDGFVKVVNIPGRTFDRVEVDNYRVSLLLEPIEGLRNLTVYDSHQNYDLVGGGVLLPSSRTRGTVDVIPFYNGTLLYTNPVTPCNGLPVCNIDVAVARQVAAGPRKVWSELNPFGKLRARSVTNATTYDLGFATLKNIFGYRRINQPSASSVDGLELIFVQTDNIEAQKQYSNELQLFGEAFGGTLDWLVGGFWLKSKPAGPARNLLLAFVPSNVTMAQAGTGSSVFTTDESKAVFGQISYKFSGISEALSGLSTDLGIRYTKDDQDVCAVTGVTFNVPVPAPSDCLTANTASTSFSKVTWTAGLNWQATDDILAYVVRRRGYRSGFGNAPKFGGTLAPFQGVPPETVDDVEIGLKTNWRLGGMPGHINVAAYDSRYKGLQATLTTGGLPPTGPNSPDGDNDPTNNPFSSAFYVNVGNAKVRGVEIDASFSPIEGLDLTASASWAEKKITKVTLPALPPALAAINNPTPRGLAPVAFAGAPNYGYTASASYTLPLREEYGEVTFGVRYFRQSLVRNGVFEAPAYDKWDATVDWKRVMNSDIDLGVFVNNIANIATPIGPHVNSAGLGFQSVYYTDPRMFGVRLRYAFGSER
jgi:iron complex outermembrane receptor protein